MKKIIFWISVVLTSIFWPISFILANRHGWEPFVFAALVLVADWVLYLKKFKFHQFLYLILPIIHPVYLFFPLIAFVFNFRSIHTLLAKVSYLVILLFVSALSLKIFYAYSIFTPDPLATDTIIKKISLIPNRNLARLYENKTTVFQEKFRSNAFESLDLNNYFFSFHPREIGGNQNLTKFSYLTLFPFLFGLFYVFKNSHRRWIFSIFISSAISLAFINNQDRFDFILYLPIMLLAYSGIKKLFSLNSSFYLFISAIFIPLSFVELIRLFVFK